MSIGLLGKKVGMTQLFSDTGDAVPVTIIEAGPCPVIQHRTTGADGYEAIQIGDRAERQVRRVTKPLKGHFEKAKVAPHKYLREFRLEAGERSEEHTSELQSP